MLETLLAEGRPLLADGAMGTNLFEAGLTSGDNPELWNASRPEAIRALAPKLRRGGRGHRPDQQFRRQPPPPGAARARGKNPRTQSTGGRERARGRRKAPGGPSSWPARSGRPATFWRRSARSPKTRRSKSSSNRSKGFARAAPTSSGSRRCPRPRKSAPRRARPGAVGAPYAVTASFDTAGKTMMGLAPAAFADLVDGFDPRPLAFGANCGVGAADLLVSILAMSEARPERNLIAKANAGVPQWHGAHIHYSGIAGTDGRSTPASRSTPARASSGDAAGPSRRMWRRCAAPSTRHRPGRAAEPRSDRRGARPARRPGRRRAGRARAPARPGAHVNAKAKSRAASRAASGGAAFEPALRRFGARRAALRSSPPKASSISRSARGKRASGSIASSATRPASGGSRFRARGSRR